MTANEPVLSELIPSWELALKAANTAAGTRTTYLRGVNAYLRWCESRDVPARLEHAQVRAFIADCLETGQPTTAKNRITALRSLSAWCVAEGELATDEMLLVKFPRIGKRHRPVLSEEDMAAMLATCDAKTFLGKRDAALLSFLADSGGRSNEVLSLVLDDVSVSKGRALVRGKGDKDRLIPFSPSTAMLLDRYLRARRKHRLAEESAALWLGDRGKTFGYDSMWYMVKKRAALAGVQGVHPHMFRRTFADRWLSAGGSTDGLMAVAGWEDMSMIKIYAGARANVRGLEEHRRLFGGEQK
jgi:site-specific recombinase XerD